jgi:hypothetical protein
MLTGEQKIQFIQSQCDAMWEARREIPLDCPYCLKTVQVGDPPCCVLLDKAIRAIIERANVVDDGMRCYERREFGRAIMGDKYLN